MPDLTDVASHFRFGENWSDFSQRIGSAQIDTARFDLARLLGSHDLGGKTFLDIGSGSGIHSLAALQLGAARVVAVDIDPASVETTRQLLERFAPNAAWEVRLCSVLEPAFADLGEFDIVYSWGVLHHTGRMKEALARASKRVKPGGQFCVALYARTWMCSFWRIEKRIYAHAPKFAQSIIRGLYSAWAWVFLSLTHLRRGRRFSWKRHIADYSPRGMSFKTDMHDWLGGYPYESIAPGELRAFMSELGLNEVRSFFQPGVRHGLVGSGCDEYVFQPRLLDAA